MNDATMMQAQIDSLKAMLADALKGLAAGQSRERKLQKALAEAMEWNWMDDDAGEVIPAWVRETLSLPQDDSALREMIEAAKAEEREAIIAEIPGGHSIDPQWVCDMIRARGDK